MAGDREVVDIAIISIDGQELQEVMSIDITETDPGAEVVATMRRSRIPIGFKQGVSTHEIDLEVKKVNPPELNYLTLKKTRKRFLLRYEENDSGQSFRASPCLVTEVSKSFNADGEATQSVKILALAHKEETTTTA